jgi:hypothetical protein
MPNLTRSRKDISYIGMSLPIHYTIPLHYTISHSTKHAMYDDTTSQNTTPITKHYISTCQNLPYHYNDHTLNAHVYVYAATLLPSQ